MLAAAPPFIVTVLLSESRQHFFSAINKAAWGLSPLQQHLVKVVQVLFINLLDVSGRVLVRITFSINTAGVSCP